MSTKFCYAADTDIYIYINDIGVCPDNMLAIKVATLKLVFKYHNVVNNHPQLGHYVNLCSVRRV